MIESKDPPYCRDGRDFPEFAYPQNKTCKRSTKNAKEKAREWAENSAWAIDDFRMTSESSGKKGQRERHPNFELKIICQFLDYSEDLFNTIWEYVSQGPEYCLSSAYFEYHEWPVIQLLPEHYSRYDR